MEKSFQKSLLVLIGVLITSLTTQAWGDNAGINSTGGANVNLLIDGTERINMIVNGSGTSDYSETTISCSSLILDKAFVRTWKNKANGNICWAKVAYKIYSTDGAGYASGETYVSLGSEKKTEETDQQYKQEWWQEAMNIDLTEGLADGAYKFEFWFRVKGDNDNNSQCDNDFWYNNGGGGSGNYKIPFTVKRSTCTVGSDNFLLNANSGSYLYAWYNDGSDHPVAAWPGASISTELFDKIGDYYIYGVKGGNLVDNYNNCTYFILNNNNGKQTSDLFINDYKGKCWSFTAGNTSLTQEYPFPVKITRSLYGPIWGDALTMTFKLKNWANLEGGTYEISSPDGATIIGGASGSISSSEGEATCAIQLPSGDSRADGDVEIDFDYTVNHVTFKVKTYIHVFRPKVIKVKDVTDSKFKNIYLSQQTLFGSAYGSWPGILQESLGNDWYIVRINPHLDKLWLNNGSNNKQTYSSGISISSLTNGGVYELDEGTYGITDCVLNSGTGVALWRVKTYDGTNTYYSNAVAADATGDDAILSFYADLYNGSATYQLQSMAANATTWSNGASIAKARFTSVYSGATAAEPGNVFVAKLNSATPTDLTAVAVYDRSLGFNIHCGASTKNYLEHGEGVSGTTGTKFIHFDISSIFEDTYDYYWVDWFNAGQTVVGSVGNAYNAKLATILGADELAPAGIAVSDGGYDGGNVRFAYNPSNNSFSRSILSGGGSLVKISSSVAGAVMVIDNLETYTWDAASEPRSFDDATNWVYTLDAKVKGASHATVTSTYNSVGYTLADNKKLLGGDEETQYDVEISYDFKTNRLLAAWMPESGDEIEGFSLESNLMVVRREDQTPTILNISGVNKVTDISKIYTTFEFWQSSWTDTENKPYANRRITSGNYVDEFYWFSLPYKCYMGDVFGIEGYGPNGSWVIMTYHGDYRAKEGWWAETDHWWYYLDRTDTLQANQGYVLRVTNLNGENSATTGIPKRFPTDTNPKLYLYFPSYDENLTIEEIGTGTPKTVQTTVPAHECTIWRGKENNPQTNEGNPSYDRRAIDSNWNVIGSPSFNTTRITSPEFSTGSYPTSPNVKGDLKYFFTWSAAGVGNKYTIQNVASFDFKALSAYLVQYAGTITWQAKDASNPLVGFTKAPARNQEESGEQTLRLVLNSNGQEEDVAYISRMAEGATEGYDLNKDLSKLMNKGGNNIYTIAGYYKMAGNCLPETTETIPVGVQLATAGEYTFSIPEGTNGTGVTLVDNVANTSTNLALTDYTVHLETGTTDGRFMLKLSPIANTPTGVDLINGENGTNGVRKVMCDGVLYIVKDGEVFDARGNRIK